MAKRTKKVVEEGWDQDPGPEPTPQEKKAEIKAERERMVESSRKRREEEERSGRSKFQEIMEKAGDFYLEEAAERDQPWEPRPPISGPARPRRSERGRR